MALEGIRGIIIPEVLITTTRGRSLRVVAITTEGIPRMPWYNQFVARGDANRIVPPPCVEVLAWQAALMVRRCPFPSVR